MYRCKLNEKVKAAPAGSLCCSAGAALISAVTIIKSEFYLLFSFSSYFSFIARTLRGRPQSVMNPAASWWSYMSPVVNEARLSLYSE